MITVGIVGLGKSAQQIHIPLLKLQSQFQITAVLSSKNRDAVHGIINNVETFSDLEEFASSDTYQLAIIVTPNHTHFDIAKRLLGAGKHVIIDKPFTCTENEANQLIALAQNRKLLLTVFHNRRWDGDFLTVKKMLESKVLGRVNYVESRFDKFRPDVLGYWREQQLPGSGVLFDIGSHLIDQVLQLFGLPNSVSAVIEQQRKGALATDAYAIDLRFDNVRVVLKTDSVTASSPFRFFIQGDRGTFAVKSVDPQDQLLHSLTNENYTDKVKDASEKFASLTLDNEEHLVKTEVGDYRFFYKNIAAHIRTGEGLLVSSEQAANVIKLIELAYKSSELQVAIGWNEHLTQQENAGV